MGTKVRSDLIIGPKAQEFNMTLREQWDADHSNYPVEEIEETDSDMFSRVLESLPKDSSGHIDKERFANLLGELCELVCGIEEGKEETMKFLLNLKENFTAEKQDSAVLKGLLPHLLRCHSKLRS